MMDLRAVFNRIRPWCLKAAALLRVGALVAAVPLLFRGGSLGIVIGIWLAASAVGLWRRMIWSWRIALIGDVLLVIGAAVRLLDAGNLQLFTYIAAGTVADVVLLSLGQAALDPGLPFQPPVA